MIWMKNSYRLIIRSFLSSGEKEREHHIYTVKAESVTAERTKNL